MSTHRALIVGKQALVDRQHRKIPLAYLATATEPSAWSRSTPCDSLLGLSSHLTILTPEPCQTPTYLPTCLPFLPTLAPSPSLHRQRALMRVNSAESALLCCTLVYVGGTYVLTLFYQYHQHHRHHNHCYYYY